MGIGRFYGGIAALIRSPDNGKYLLLRRAADKDFASGVWECVTGRVDQGEGFEDALRREVYEEIGAEVRIDYIIGTTHFYRGPAEPEYELVGVVYGCSLDDPGAVRIGPEHSEYRWVTAVEADELLAEADPSTRWMRRIIQRADKVRGLLPPALISYHRANGFEMG